MTSHLLNPATGGLGGFSYLGDINGDESVDWIDLGLLGNYITSGANPYGIGSEVHVGLTAELSPSPTDAVFDSDGEWQTFAVSTNADSLFVTVNGPGSDVVIEIAGGSVPPPRNYCGPEPSDSPSRARRNGWNLHLAGCVEGATQVVLMDYVSRDTLIVYDVTVGQTQREDEDDGSDSSIPTGEKLYWVRWGRLYRANLDGTNVEAIIDGNWANISSWASIDRSRGKIYWSLVIHDNSRIGSHLLLENSISRLRGSRPFYSWLFG